MPRLVQALGVLIYPLILIILGDCCFKGDGVEQDEAEAVKWYRKAAEQYNDDAQYMLGCCLQ